MSNLVHRLTLAVLSLSACLGLAGQSVFVWDGSSSATWTVGANWDVNAAPGTGDIARFNAGTPFDPSIGSATTTGSIEFLTGSDQAFGGTNTLTLNGVSGAGVTNSSGVAHAFSPAITLGGTQTWSTSGSGSDLTFNRPIGLGSYTLTIDSGSGTTVAIGTGTGDIISGTGAIVKNGAGTLSFSGNITNTYDGGLTVNAGTVTFAGNTALGAGTITLAGGTLTSAGTGTRTVANTLAVTGTTTVAGAASRHYIFSGNTISGSGSLGIDNTSDSGAASVGFSGSGFTLAAGVAFADSFSELRLLNTTGTQTFDGVISGGGLVRRNAAGGTTVLNGNNTFTGTMILDAGTVSIGHDSALGAGTLDFSGGTLAATADRTIANPITFTGNSILSGGAGVDFVFTSNTISGGAGSLALDNTADSGVMSAAFSGSGFTLLRGISLSDAYTQLRLANSSGTQTFSGVIAGSGSIVRDVAGGTTVLGASNTFSGGLTLSAGTVAVGNNNALGSGTFTFAGGAIEASGAARSLPAAVSLTGDGTVTGTLNLTFTGGVTQSGGNRTLTVDNTGVTTISTGALTLAETNQARTLTIDVAGTSGGVTVSSVIQDGAGTGADGLTKTGAGTLTLSSGANTYSGLTTVANGTLAYGASNIIGTGAVTVDGASSILAMGLNRTDSVGTVTVANGGSITGTGTSALTSTGTFEMQSGSVGAILAGSGIALNKTTSGTVTLTGANTYTGVTTVSAGTLQLQGATATAGTGTAGTTVSGAGAILALDGGVSTSNGTLTLSGSGATLANVTGTNTWTNSVDVTNTATISAAAGTLNLGSTRPAFTISGHTQPTESGYVTIGNQTLTFSGAGAIQVNDRIRDFAGQTAGTSHTYPPLALAYGPETSSPGNIVVNMTGSGSVKFAANANSYTGTTTVQQGTLILGTKSNTAAPHDTVTDSFHAINGPLVIGTGSGPGATVQLGTGGPANELIASTSPITFYHDGTFNVNGQGQTVGALTFNGGTVNIGTGVLYLNSDVTVNATPGHTATINAASGGTLSLTLSRTGGVDTGPDATRTFTVAHGAGNTSDLTVAAVIESGDVVKAGTGVMMFNQNNAYLGTTAVNAGILNVQMGDDGSFRSGLGYGDGTSAQGTSVASGATLQLQGGITITKEYVGLAGTGYDPGTGALGALNNVSGDNSFGAASTTRINLDDHALITATAGTLTIPTNLSSTGNNKALTIGGAGDVTISGGINTGSGSTTTLTKEGTGTLILSGASGYQGATQINEGLVSVRNSFGLGSVTTGANGTFVESGAELQLQGGISVGGESLTLKGAGIGGTSGALTNAANNNSFAGTITLGADATIRAAASTTLTLSGGITSDGTRALTINVGAGGTVTSSSAIDIGTVTTVPAVNTNPPHYAAGISTGTTGTLTKLGAGNLTFSGGATSKLDGITLSVGSITVTGSGTMVKTGPLSAAASTTLTIDSGAKVEAYYPAATNTTFAGTMAGAGEFIKDGTGTLTFNNSFAATALTLTLNGGRLSLAGGAQLEFGTIHITGDTILDFNNSAGTFLKSASLVIDAGVTVSVENWIAVAGNSAASTVWYSTGYINGGSLGASDISGGTPLGQITFAGWNSGNFPTTWVSSSTAWGHFDHEIRPVPEPATYGALLLSAALGLLALRRLRRRRSPSAAA